MTEQNSFIHFRAPDTWWTDPHRHADGEWQWIETIAFFKVKDIKMGI